MRILIIAQPRTGSTVFLKWLSDELNYQYINEPFNMYKKIEIDNLFDYENVVVKLIYEIGRGEWFYDKRIDNIEHLLSMNWDHIFILTRNDLEDQAISKVWADTNHKWHTNYQVDEKWVNHHKKTIEKYIKQLNVDRNFLRSIKHEQITYEGIYNTMVDVQKICDIIPISKTSYISKLSIKNRYRGGEITKNSKLL